jgi:lysine/ornithine N-monooxygenase
MNQAFQMKATSKTDVAIIGAGPYGLSIAAHLRAVGVEHQIFGFPMSFWAEHMPKGMFLKSDGFASNLYDPNGSFTLRHFCNESGIEYADIGVPVRLDTFSAFGLAFQRRFAPDLQRKTVISLSRSQLGFLLQLEDGQLLSARSVVMATGIGHFQHIPEELSHLPSQVLSHSSQHSDLGQFKGREVIVIGGGSSASDLAVLLHESGAQVSLVARSPAIKFHDKMTLPRAPWKRFRYPMSTIGPGWQSLVYAEAPLMFRWLPEATRLRIVASHLGPSGGWFMKDRFTKVPHLLGYRVKQADLASTGRVQLQLVANNGAERELQPEHIIAATGYRLDVDRLPLLSSEVRSQLKLINKTPVLSAAFESSLRGLYFVGAIAANSFGPVMRFAAGAKFTARRISSRLAGTASAADASESVLTSRTAA